MTLSMGQVTDMSLLNLRVRWKVEEQHPDRSHEVNYYKENYRYLYSLGMQRMLSVSQVSLLTV
jgi:hypothetical protein